MAPTDDDRWGPVRRSVIAFCSGWWVAGVVLGLAHFLELWTRGHHTPLELLGVPLVAGTVLPGARPVFAAAAVLDRTGLPVGLTALIVGGVLAVGVWVALPVALYVDRGHRSHSDRSLAVAVAAAIPYLAGGAGLHAIYRRTSGADGERLRAALTALAVAVIGYLAGALVVFAGALVVLGV